MLAAIHHLRADRVRPEESGILGPLPWAQASTRLACQPEGPWGWGGRNGEGPMRSVGADGSVGSDETDVEQPK
jgi:hypothetical protein